MVTGWQVAQIDSLGGFAASRVAFELMQSRKEGEAREKGRVDVTLDWLDHGVVDRPENTFVEVAADEVKCQPPLRPAGS